MEEYYVKVLVYRKDGALVDQQLTDLSFMNVSGVEVEEFVEVTVEEDRGRFMFDMEGEDE